MIKNTFETDENHVGTRLDVFLAKQLAQYSRASIQQCIKQGDVVVNDIITTSKKHILSLGDIISICVQQQTATHDEPENITLNKAYEDDDLLVIEKPRGLVVHPGAGCPKHTLLNALIFHYPSNKSLPQAGMIHRLDKDTTGLLIVAKSPEAYHQLNKAMQKRQINRHYLALVKGIVHQGGTIDEPLARHHKNRQKFTIHPTGKIAITHYSIKQRFKEHTLLEVKLETGRTHQIRVHLHHIGHSIVGDQTYNRGHCYKQNSLSPQAIAQLQLFKRQALHAYSLRFEHPISGEEIYLERSIPEDFQQLLTSLG